MTREQTSEIRFAILTLICAFLLMVAHSAHGLEKLSGYVERGGKRVQSIGGGLSSEKVMQSYPLSTVTVYETGTLTLATIYADAAGATVKSNPFTSDGAGYYEFFAADACYDVRFSGGDITVPWTISNQCIVPTAANVLLRSGGSQPLTADLDLGNFNVESKNSMPVIRPDVVADGVTDDAPVIQAALDAASTATGGKVVLPAGVIKIQSGLTIPAGSILEGVSSQHAGAFGTRILKDGNFDGITVGQGAVLRDLKIDGDTGNGGDGVYVMYGRSLVQNVFSNGHGGVGIRVGGKDPATAHNTNLWRLIHVTARSNTSHGVYVHHAFSPTEANGGLALGVDAGGNGGDGVFVDNAISNNFYGVSSQGNTGYGVRFGASASRNYFEGPYVENNTAGGAVFDSGSSRNRWVPNGTSSGDFPVDNNATPQNWVLSTSTILGTKPPLFYSTTAFEDLVIQLTNYGSFAGYWNLYRTDANRNLNIDLLGTGGSGNVNIKEGLVVDLNTNLNGTLTTVGNTTVGGSLTLYSSNVGEWTHPAFDAARYTASAGLWTVDSADENEFSYMIVGKTMYVNFRLTSTTVTSTPQELRITIPASKVSAVTHFGQTFWYYDGASPWAIGQCHVTAGGTTISLGKDPTRPAWSTTANSTDVRGQIVFQIN